MGPGKDNINEHMTLLDLLRMSKSNSHQTYVNPNKDRSLRGKARIKARRAAKKG